MTLLPILKSDFWIREYRDHCILSEFHVKLLVVKYVAAILDMITITLVAFQY